MSETTQTPAPGTEQLNDAPAATEGATSPTQPPEAPKRPEWADRRVANITRRASEAEQRAERAEQERAATAARYEAALKTLPDDHPLKQQPQMSREDIERQAELRGAEKARTEERERAETSEFVRGCNTLAEKVQKEFGNDGFAAAASGWTKAGLDIPNPATGTRGNKAHRELIGLIMEQDDGARIFESIGKDPDFAAYLLDPATPQMQAAFEIAKRLPAAQARSLIADAAEAQAENGGANAETSSAPVPVAAKPPSISSAPRPPTQPAASRASSGGSRDLSDPKLSMEEYARVRSEQRKSARAH